jgi:hypothetical protein
MSERHVAFVSKSFLRSHWDLEYRARHDSENEKALDDRLALWAKRRVLRETLAESAFIDVIFRDTWAKSRPASGVSTLGSLFIQSLPFPVQVQTAAVATPILLSATSARQPRARFHRCSASLRVSEALLMSTRSGRETAATPLPLWAPKSLGKKER